MDHCCHFSHIGTSYDFLFSKRQPILLVSYGTNDMYALVGFGHGFKLRLARNDETYRPSRFLNA